ncbi:uncharacterized protein LOC129777484 isoform X2 [Toxorhynchites rutilus septentrionalis]|uniref:uncharacterized protein LOC129777484 isoform X2 n=1 Tax=Toxorhynchites rutilus septentrionalis TaxID=329112 RepID=UPI00247A04A7|nr:uncharacterized protein LOC129777484 isoform X2 [Toxorhynchites rutilus septentrionalis]
MEKVKVEISCFDNTLHIMTLVSNTRKLWIAFLANRYPYLKFTRTNNIRSLVDTSRNPGVFIVLLQVEGICDVQSIKVKFIEHVLNRRDPTGRLSFYRLKFPLISCWGQYAFLKKSKNFKIENHILLAPSLYRGRLLTEANLQDYVNEIVSKYMPPDIPPWQIFCIPISTSGTVSGSAECDSGVPYYYLLYRIHHLLLDEQEKLCISDLLLIDQSKNDGRNHRRRLSSCNSIFSNTTEKPVYLPLIWQNICTMVGNRWNAFVYQYDPLESPDIDQKQIKGIQHLLSVAFIGIIAVLSDFCKGFSKISGSPLMKIDFLKSLIDREIQKRNLTFATVWSSIATSLDPINVIKEVIFLVWKIGATITLMVPWHVFREMEAVRIYVLMKKIKRNTLVGFLLENVPIYYGGFLEYWKGLMLLYNAPKLIFETFFEHKPNMAHHLQNVSLCGRKVVSWSERIDTNEFNMNHAEHLLKRKGGQTHKTSCKLPSGTEILLGVLSKSVQKLLQSIRNEIDQMPSQVQLSGRCMTEDCLLGSTNYKTGNSTFMALNLPIDTTGTKQLLTSVRVSTTEVHQQQLMLNFLPLTLLRHDCLINALPAVILKLLANYLSRRFAITITEVIENSESSFVRCNLLGDKICDILYFRPPQSNTCVSLTIQNFDGKVRLACMADSQISPKHLASTAHFRKLLSEVKTL